MPDSVRLVDYRRPRDRNLDLTPLLDVVFQLLIFFLVSSQIVAPKSKLELPMGEPGAQPEDAISVRVEVSAAGELRVDGEVAADAEFDAALKAALDGRGVERVQFHGDRTLEYGEIVGLMERAQQAGAKAIEIVKNPRPVEAETRP